MNGYNDNPDQSLEVDMHMIPLNINLHYCLLIHLHMRSTRSDVAQTTTSQAGVSHTLHRQTSSTAEGNEIMSKLYPKGVTTILPMPGECTKYTQHDCTSKNTYIT